MRIIDSIDLFESEHQNMCSIHVMDQSPINVDHVNKLNFDYLAVMKNKFQTLDLHSIVTNCGMYMRLECGL